MTRVTTLFFLCPIFFMACGQAAPLSVESEPSFTELETEAALAMVNGFETDFSRLIEEMHWSPTSARSLIRHRAGRDGVLNTFDDHWVSSLEELLGLEALGVQEIYGLIDYARSIGFFDIHAQARAEVALKVVNHPAVGFDVLDTVIGLDVRAAKSISEMRAGPDGIRGTDDDYHFSSLKELDAVPYVGVEAIAKLARFGFDSGY